MGVLLLLLGAVLIGLTWKQAWRQALNEEKDAYYLQSVKGLEQRVADLEAKISEFELFPQEQPAPESEFSGKLDYKLELLTQAVSGLGNQIETLLRKNEGDSHGDRDFSEYIQEAGHEAEFRDIRDAYLSGKSVTEIAQQFGKGKGEVELILNLQKSSR
jgi:hypothetical protein